MPETQFPYALRRQGWLTKLSRNPQLTCEDCTSRTTCKDHNPRITCEDHNPRITCEGRCGFPKPQPRITRIPSAPRRRVAGLTSPNHPQRATPAFAGDTDTFPLPEPIPVYPAEPAPAKAGGRAGTGFQTAERTAASPFGLTDGSIIREILKHKSQ